MRDGYKIFDAHMHYSGIFAEGKGLIDYMDENGIDSAIVNTLNIDANMGILKTMDFRKHLGQENNLDLSSLSDIELFYDFRNAGQPSHNEIIKLQKIHPKRVFPFFWYNPNDPNDLNQENGLKLLNQHLNNGFKGVKLQPAMIPFQIKQIYPVAEKLVEKNLPLYIHPCSGLFSSERTHPFSLIPLIKEYNELKIIIGHSSFTMEFCIETQIAIKSLGSMARNMFVETSVSIPFGIIAYIKALGEDKVLFGSDSPPAGPWSIEFDKINLLKLPKKVKDKIFWKNTMNLLNLD